MILKPGGPLLCKDQCDIGVNGFANIILDPNLCTESQKANERIMRSKEICASFDRTTKFSLNQTKTRNNECLTAVQSELSTCGGFYIFLIPL